ncbi:hypothetical protein F2Q69_00024673 [Brassica cretica]|uniref:Myb-like domain-containing protein n=1 Tax=Brassica cretica TaxID=69181 RepID=A0A8S9QUW2_BRACR|nr:hypothetical protein F2Q69_00024673 [Brassica cretica]
MLDWGVDQVHQPNHDHDPYQKQQKQLQGCRKGPWTPEEDKLLTEYVISKGEGKWSSVAKCAVDQVHQPNHDHDPYQKQQKQLQGCRKGPWTPEEDKLLTEYVTSKGEGKWSSVAKCAAISE